MTSRTRRTRDERRSTLYLYLFSSLLSVITKQHALKTAVFSIHIRRSGTLYAPFFSTLRVLFACFLCSFLVPFTAVPVVSVPYIEYKPFVFLSFFFFALAPLGTIIHTLITTALAQ